MFIFFGQAISLSICLSFNNCSLYISYVARIGVLLVSNHNVSIYGKESSRCY